MYPQLNLESAIIRPDWGLNQHVHLLQTSRGGQSQSGLFQTDEHFGLKSERRGGGTHLEHDPVLFLRLLNHTHVAPHFGRLLDGAGPQLPRTITSHSKRRSNEVFVCSSGRAPPSFTGLWCLRLPHSNSNTSQPWTDTVFVGVSQLSSWLWFQES